MEILKEMESVARPNLSRGGHRGACVGGSCPGNFVQVGEGPSFVNVIVEAENPKRELLALLAKEQARLARINAMAKKGNFLQAGPVNAGAMKNMLSTTMEMLPSALTVNIVESAGAGVTADVVH